MNKVAFIHASTINLKLCVISPSCVHCTLGRAASSVFPFDTTFPPLLDLKTTKEARQKCAPLNASNVKYATATNDKVSTTPFTSSV